MIHYAQAPSFQLVVSVQDKAKDLLCTTDRCLLNEDGLRSQGENENESWFFFY